MGRLTSLLCVWIYVAVAGANHVLVSSGHDSPGSVSKEMCNRYAEAVETCYFDSIGSRHATPKEYPHMVFIGFGNASSIKWLCGGNLISDRFVLTAGHCTVGTPYQGGPQWVKVGDYDLESEKDEKLGLGKPVVYKVVESRVHPEYKPRVFYNDISLLKLNTSVEFNKFVRPICLESEHDLPSQYLIASGYGRVQYGGKRNTIMQQVNMTVVPWEKCNDDYTSVIRPGNAPLGNGINKESMICAGEALSGRDVCSMESGNPLQRVLDEPKCMFSLVGTASFSPRCGGETPGVYTRISHFVPWIESVVWGQ